MTELASLGTSGTRGATARAKLQAELAQQKGTFFKSVLQSMSRRMAPISPHGSELPGASGQAFLVSDTWNLWLLAASRIGAVAIPGHDSFRLPDGWSGGSSDGHYCSAGSPHRAEQLGWREDGPCNPPLPPRRSSCFYFCQQADVHSVSKQSICATSGSALGPG